jgi:uncharacterized protein
MYWLTAQRATGSDAEVWPAVKPEPLIWILCGLRKGDTAQAKELVQHVGGQIVEKQLAFNALHYMPNALRPTGLQSLTASAKDQLKAPWPDLVVATGKRTAPIAVAIKRLSGGRSVLVQLGRPRMAVHHFDLVITTPQYGLPPAENIITLSTPYASPAKIGADVVAQWNKSWAHLPRPWIMAALGASKYPLQLGNAELDVFAQRLNEAAKPFKASVLLFDSPRSLKQSLHHVASRLEMPHWESGTVQAGAYHAALALADYFVVTGDSVSMTTEMLQTGKPAAVFRLPQKPHVKWSAQSGIGAVLAKSGVLSPPRDTDGFIASLVASGLIGELGKSWGRGELDREAHDAAVSRIRSLLKKH